MQKTRRLCKSSQSWAYGLASVHGADAVLLGRLQHGAAFVDEDDAG